MKELSSFIDNIFGKYAMIVRYLISGGTSFGTNIVALYILTEYFFGKQNYLISAIFSFIVGFIVSFLMMKHWTFQDSSTDGIHEQLTVYFSVAIMNLLLNTLLVYLFVEFMGSWYIFAQVAASLIIAVWSFFIYKYLIFV